jgi:ketosteroid isomerase-like protein
MATTREQTIEALEHQLAKAVGACDGPACAALLDDEFSAILAIDRASFEITLRDQWIAAVTSCSARSVIVDDIVISLHADVAIVTLLISEDSFAVSSPRLIVTDVWRRTGEDWKLIERHAGGRLHTGVFAPSDSAA